MSGAMFPAPAAAPPDQSSQGFWGSLVPQYLASKGLQGQYLGNLAQSLATLPERATQAAGSLQYGGSYDPGPALESAGLVMGGTSFGAPSGAFGAGPIRAYHGSPYDFERFDINRIGTGEGAQAYGHGLYFAENPSVAQTYKEAGRGGTPMDWTVAGGNPDWRVPSWAASKATAGGPKSQGAADVLADFRQRVAEKEANDPEFFNLEGLRNIRDALEAYTKGNVELKKPGHMYEVNIRADPEQFLNWDVPLLQQPRAVQQLVRDIPQSESGKSAYNALALANQRPQSFGGPLTGYTEMRPNDALASAALREAGIPGIRYLDQGSRAGGAGTSNYVLFRDDIIDILRKYGLAGGMAGSALPYAFAPSNAELNQ
jgi:hypothetical protein